MKQQFVVGDQVQVTSGMRMSKGMIGVVVSINDCYDEPFNVDFGNYNEYFEEHELRMVDATLHTGGKETTAALRYNKGKPESDYIFTYKGGIRAAFGGQHPYYDTLKVLQKLYNIESPTDDDLRVVLDVLHIDAVCAGDSILDLLAQTNVKGAAKYEAFNYLKGANWRQYYQCAARHAEKIGNGEEHDAEGFPHRGNFFFNVLMICHCASTGLGTDDRPVTVIKARP